MRVSESNQLSPLIPGQINLIKFIEPNKFDNAYTSTFETYLFDQIFLSKGNTLKTFSQNIWVATKEGNKNKKLKQ